MIENQKVFQTIADRPIYRLNALNALPAPNQRLNRTRDGH